MGVTLSDVHVSAVLHGDAGRWALTDPAYNAFTMRSGGNPNTALIRDLIQAGGSVELCAETMSRHGWQKKDLRPGVRMVVGAYPRIIDPQQQGYAYTRI